MLLFLEFLDQRYRDEDEKNGKDVSELASQN